MAKPEFKAWSLLSLASTAHGAPTYPDELGVSYVYDTTVPNGKHIENGDLAVIRDNQFVLGAGWIDSEPFSSSDLAGLKDVDGIGDLPGW